MYNIQGFDNLFHRSRDRIRDMGEVFTPEKYVQEMLSILENNNPKIWSDPKITFFEPCCGNGNFVVGIFRRRLNCFYEEEIKKGNCKYSAFCAVANSLNTLWAIDIDRENIEICRARIWEMITIFFEDKLNKSLIEIIEKDRDFFAHLICAINWHVYENETLSALSLTEDMGFQNAARTKPGYKWLKNNDWEQINFNEGWVGFYEDCKKNNLEPILYQKSKNLINSLVLNKKCSYIDFPFLKVGLKDL